MLDGIKEKRRLRALLLVSLLLVGVAAGASMAVQPACERTIVTGSLVTDLDFRVTAVAVYASGMFVGNPVLAHVAGTVPAPGWYTIPLPGFRDPAHVRVRSADADVAAFFDDGSSLTFSLSAANGTFPARVAIDYIAGSAWWSHRFELDMDRNDLTMVGRVFWRAEALFRDVDLLLVSGEVHTANPNGTYPAAPAAGALDGSWFPLVTSSSTATDDLRTFSVPSSKDAGIYIVHRAERVDLPGAAGRDAKACTQAGFSVRVYESPLHAAEYVLAEFAYDDRPMGAGDAWGAPASAGLPSLMILENRGEVPWAPGVLEVWQDGVLVGSDNLPYTPVGASAVLRAGTTFDVEATRAVEVSNTTLFVNYTLRNLDAVAHEVRLTDAFAWKNVTLSDPFGRAAGAITATVHLEPRQEATLGFRAKS